MALRAPDHGTLRPWCFAVIRGAALEAFGAVFVEAARQRDPHADAECFRAKVMAAPLIIAMAGAAAAMNMLNALNLLGYGGFWATGANAHDAGVRRALGFGATDRLIGFLYVGTPRHGSPPPARPAREPHVRTWTGAVDGVPAASEHTAV